MEEYEESDVLSKHPGEFWLSIGGAIVLGTSLALVSFYIQAMRIPADQRPGNEFGQLTSMKLIDTLLPFCFVWYGLPQMLLALMLFHAAFRVKSRNMDRVKSWMRGVQKALIVVMIVIATRSRIIWSENNLNAAWELWVYQLLSLSVICGTWVLWQVERVFTPLPLLPRFSLMELVVFVMAAGAVLAAFVPI